MSARLRVPLSFEGAARVVLDDSIALHGAELGNVQLLAGDRLVIVLQRGFKPPFLKFFREVGVEDGTACGRALRTGVSVLVNDTETDTEYKPYRNAARKAGYRSVITVPLITSTNLLFGTVSNHFVNVHSPTPIEIETLNSYGKIAAECLYGLLDGESIEHKALSMQRKLYAAAGSESSPVE